MNIRQVQTIKATEVSTMHCKPDCDMWSREVVGISRAEWSAEGGYSKLWRVRWWKSKYLPPWDSSERESSSILAGLGSLIVATESNKWPYLVRATADEQQKRPTLVTVTTVIHLGAVRIVWIHVHRSKVGLDAYLGTTNWVVAFTDVLWVVHAMIAPFRQLFGFNFNLKLKFEEYGAVEDSEESGYFSVGLNIEVYMAPLNVKFLWWLVTWLVKPSSFNHYHSGWQWHSISHTSHMSSFLDPENTG